MGVSYKQVVQSYKQQMSSNQFLERFKGRTQVIGKEGVHGALGNIGNTNMAAKTHTSHAGNSTGMKPQHQATTPIDKQPISKKVQNPFLVSNPFYLEEEERIKDEKAKEERLREERAREKEEREKEKEKEKQKIKYESKKSMKSSKSMEKRVSGKEWTKLGGLGANIGGDEWLEKKKKLDKMQEFAEQVKVINSQKVVIPRPTKAAEVKLNPRQKALEYSKNVPKPTIVKEVESQPEVMVIQKEEMTELEAYALKHEQLKIMLKHQL